MTYVMNVDHARNRVEIVAYDYDHDFGKFFLELQKAVFEAKGRGNHFDIITDFSQMDIASPVLPKDLADEAAAQTNWCVANGMRKSASILKSTLFKMQLQRVTSDFYTAFDNRADAENWLNEA